MAELAGKHGTYVKISCMVWWDKTGKRAHVTSNDPDIPNNGMHMSAKPGTMTDQNLVELLNKFGCGPAPKEAVKDPDGAEAKAKLEKLTSLMQQRLDGGFDETNTEYVLGFLKST